MRRIASLTLFDCVRHPLGVPRRRPELRQGGQRARRQGLREGDRDPPRHSPESGVVEPRDADRRARSERAAGAWLEGDDRDREDRRRRCAAGERTGAGHRRPCGYGCTAGHRSRRSPVQVHGAGDLCRARGRRLACVRPRHPCRRGARRGVGPLQPARSHQRYRDVHLPAGRGRAAAWREGRRGPDGRGRRLQGAQAGRHHRAPHQRRSSGRGR